MYQDYQNIKGRLKLIDLYHTRNFMFLLFNLIYNYLKLKKIIIIIKKFQFYLKNISLNDLF